MADQMASSLNITDEASPKQEKQADYLLWRIPILRIPNSDHPLFQLERKQITWAQTPEQAKQHSRQYLLCFVLILILIWVAATYIFGSMDSPSGTYTPFRPYYYAAQDTWAFTVLISIGFSALIDLIVFAYTMNSISREQNMLRLDLLRLSTCESELLKSKYTLARLRTFRPYLLLFGARLAVVMMFFLLLVYVELSDSGNLLSELSRSLQDYPVQTVVVLFTFSLLVSLFLIEPFWRIRTISALGLMISTYVRRVASAAIFSFFVAIIIWLTQGIIIYAILFSVIEVGDYMSSLWFDLTGEYYSSEITITILTIFMILTFLIVYFYYRILQRIALHRTLKRLD